MLGTVKRVEVVFEHDKDGFRDRYGFWVFDDPNGEHEQSYIEEKTQLKIESESESWT